MDGDGKASLLMSLWDTGTGASTILRQVVAEALTIPVEDVAFVVTDTDAVPFESGPGGSRVTYTGGQAVLGAADDLRARLALLAAEYLGGSADLMRLQDSRFFVEGEPGNAISLREVASRAVSATQMPLKGEMHYTSPPTEITSYSTQVAEVEVDRETGQVQVNRIVTVHDVGTVLNPLSHQGQIEGGVIQGLGYALMEEMVTEEGHISTLSLGDYKIPTINDLPKLETILLGPAPGPAPYQGKGIGESSNIPVAGAIANAVYDAVGVRIMDLPITAEKVLAALRAKL
jgi:CO/xanthine dehydrogenase Mo-binding subunit